MTDITRHRGGEFFKAMIHHFDHAFERFGRFFRIGNDAAIVRILIRVKQIRDPVIQRQLLRLGSIMRILTSSGHERNMSDMMSA